MKHSIIIVALLFSSFSIFSQSPIKWSRDGDSFYMLEGGEIVNVALPQNTKKTVVTKSMVTPNSQVGPLTISNYEFSADYSKVLIFTNTKKVWRFIMTRG